tara:strand:- start:100 stop:240 length:141 start_codon:yes stop_codon:yes gene_type:complete
MVNYIHKFRRVITTEGLIVAFLSFLEISNIFFNVCDSKVYYLKRGI